MKREVMEWMETLVWATVAVVLLFTFVARTAVVSGDSMNPTYHDGDRMIISALGFKPSYGDVVVFAEADGSEENLIKRVIATEGQTIDIDYDSGKVTVDGTVLDEPYIAEPTNEKGADKLPATVPAGHVFVMGDNRNHSRDSRFTSVGMVDTRLILGRAWWQFFPFDKLGFIG